MSRALGTRVPTSNWRAKLLRLTTFHAPTAIGKAEGWWELATEQAPENSTFKPKVGERIEVGAWKDSQLLIQEPILWGGYAEWLGGIILILYTLGVGAYKP